MRLHKLIAEVRTFIHLLCDVPLGLRLEFATEFVEARCFGAKEIFGREVGSEEHQQNEVAVEQ